MLLIAQEVLSIVVERVFSVADYSSSGGRNRLSGATLETDILLKTNKQLLLSFM